MTDSQHDDAQPEIGSQRDPEWIAKSRGILERYAAYFRPEVRGWDNVPDKGPFLIVANHSGGQTPPDLPILMTEWWKRRGVDEPVYGLFHSFFLALPGVGPVVAKAGALEAGHGNAEAVLRKGGIVCVFPGGDHEALRPFSQRNQIDFANRTGFIRLALRNQVPIVPCVSCGAHESIVVLSRGERLARILPHMRLMRVKVYPIVLGPPWGVSFGMPNIPLPTQVTVQLCPPIDLSDRYGPEAAEDDEAVATIYDEITSTMQSVLDDLAAERSQRSLLDRAAGAVRSVRNVIAPPR